MMIRDDDDDDDIDDDHITTPTTLQQYSIVRTCRHYSNQLLSGRVQAWKLSDEYDASCSCYTPADDPKPIAPYRVTCVCY